MIRLTFLIFSFSILSAGCNAAEHTYDKYAGAVPKEIYSLMKARECSPISRFYDGSIYAPSFVYNTSLFKKARAIFFACQLDNPKTEDKYKIVIVEKMITTGGVKYSDFRECPSEILYRKMPGGLSLNFNESDLKRESNLWEDTRRYRFTENINIPSDQSPQWLLDERRDGTGYGFFCAENQWYNIAYD
tara:strand:- start:423 stop:989 length:567 start_codon:yes stop_codon:yes gene_type:complete